MEFSLGDLLITSGLIFVLFSLPAMVVRMARKRGGRG